MLFESFIELMELAVEAVYIYIFFQRFESNNRNLLFNLCSPSLVITFRVFILLSKVTD